MKKTSRKQIDLRLKIAIIESRRTQRRVAVDTRIGETRLSEIVGRRGVPATDDEQRRIAKYLGRAVEDLFDREPLDDEDASPVADDAKRAS